MIHLGVYVLQSTAFSIKVSLMDMSRRARNNKATRVKLRLRAVSLFLEKSVERNAKQVAVGV